MLVRNQQGTSLDWVVDTNTCTENEPTIRSRWVAKEFKTDQRPDLFAPTPPLEGVKLIVSNCASRRGAQGRAKQTVLAVLDVRRAYFYAPARRRVFVKLPPEDYQAGDEHRCGLLLVSLYGTLRRSL